MAQGLTQIGAVPLNQLNALPLYSAQQAAAGGSVTFNLGGGISRAFTPTQMGIAAANFAADVNGHVVLRSAFVNVTGCRTLLLLLTRNRTDAALGLALGGISIFLQYRLTPTDVPPTSLGAGAQNLQACGVIPVTNAALVYPAMQAANEVQRAALGVDSSVVLNAGGFNALPPVVNSTATSAPITGGAFAVEEVFSLTVRGMS